MGIIQKVSAMVDIIRGNNEMLYAVKNYKDAMHSGMKFRGDVRCEHYRGDKCLWDLWEPKSNLFTTEGMAKINNVIFYSTAKDSQIYINIFKTDKTVAAGDTAALLGSGNAYGACQDPADYDEADDGTTTASTGYAPKYTTASTSTAVITNAAAKGHFVMADTLTVYGAYLSNISQLSSTTGTLYCAKQFSASRAVIADDEIYVTYQITLSSS